MEIGDIKEMCFNKDNILIPSGYLECDGQEITEDMFPELHFHLSDGVIEGPIKLPKVKRKKNGEEYIFVTLIAYTDKKINDTKNFNAEFVIKTEVQNNINVKTESQNNINVKTELQNNINVKKVHAFKRHVWRK